MQLFFILRIHFYIDAIYSPVTKLQLINFKGWKYCLVFYFTSKEVKHQITVEVKRWNTYLIN